MKKGYILVFLALFFVLPLAHAADFRMSIEPVKDQIYTTESAIFQLSITNEGQQTETYTMSSDVVWDLMSNPLPDYYSGMKIAPNETKSTLLIFSPPTKITTGAKRITLDVESKSGEKKSLPVTIYIKSTSYEPQGYIPFVITSLIVEPTEINPQNKFNVRVKIKNGNVLNLTDVAIEVTTLNDIFYKKRVVNLGPLEERTESFVITLNPMTLPMADSLVATVSYGDTYFKPAKEEITILGYSVLMENTTSTSEFLRTRHTAEVWNNGNQKLAQLYKVETSLFKSLFTVSNPDSKILKQDGKRYLVWELVLDPGEKISIEYGENYRPVFIILLILIVSVTAYYMFRSKIKLEKRAEVIGVEEGGISKIKVTLNIRNRCGKKIEHIQIIEKVPHLASLVREDYLGTLKPSKILQHDVKGMLVKWDIDELDGYEERMITYKIQSKLTILGSITLSPAVAKFKNPNGSAAITHSNTHNLNL